MELNPALVKRVLKYDVGRQLWQGEFVQRVGTSPESYRIFDDNTCRIDGIVVLDHEDKVDIIEIGTK